MEKINITIPLLARPKKNSQQILKNHKTGKYFISQSETYKNFERECWQYLVKYRFKINEPINLKCVFVVTDKRRRDISNLINAVQDILVKYEVLADDNYNIIRSLDGTRILYKPNEEPKIIIEITEYKEE